MDDHCLDGCAAKEASTIELIQAIFVALLWTLGAVGILLVALCLPPVHLNARFDSLHLGEETPVDWDEVVLNARLSGLLGAVQVSLERRDGEVHGQLRLFGFPRRIGGRKVARGEPTVARDTATTQPTAKPKKGTKPARKRFRPQEFTLSHLRRLLPEVRWLMSRVWHLFKLKVKGELVYGFPDPFATAMTNALIAGLPISPELKLKPDYVEGRLDGWLEMTMRIYPLQGVFLLTRVALRPAVRSIWWPHLREAIWRSPKRTKEAV